MADGTAPSAVEPQAGTTAPTQPQAGTPEAAAAEQPQAGTTDTGTAADERISLEEARKLRQEAQSLRRRLGEYEQRQKDADEAKLSEHEKAVKRAAELEAQLGKAQAALRDSRTRLAVEREARALRFVDEDAALALLPKAGELEFGEDGEPKNVRPLLKKLAESKPYLVAADPTQQPPAGTAFGNGVNGTNGAPLGATPRPDSGRALTEAALRQQEAAAFQSVRRGWG